MGRDGDEADVPALLADDDGVVVRLPLGVVFILHAVVELDEPARVAQAGHYVPVEVAPRLQRGNVFLAGGKLLLQVLYVGLVFLEAFYDFIARHVLADNLVRLAVSKVALHAQQHVLILRALLQESLQGGVHFAALAFHHMHHAQAADAVEERLIFLVIDKERQLFHFRNHATASFLCSW